MNYRRLARYLLTLLLLAVVIPLYLERAAISDRMEQVAAEQLSVLIGEQLTLESLELSPLTLSLEITGLRVDPVDASVPGPLLSVGRISLRLADLPLGLPVHLERLEVEDVLVDLSLEDGHPVQFAGLLELLEDTGEPETPTPPPDPDAEPPVRVDAITLSRVHLLARDLKQDWEVDIHGDQATLETREGRPGPLSASLGPVQLRYQDMRQPLDSLQLTADLGPTPARIQQLALKGPGAQVSASGAAWLEDPGPDAPRLELQVDATVDLSVVVPFLPESAPDLEGQVVLSGPLTVGKSFQAGGRLQFDHLVIDPFKDGTTPLALHSGSLSYAVDEAGVTVAEAVLLREEGSLALEGHLGFSEKLPLEVRLRLNAIDLGALLEDLTLTDPWMTAGLSGTIRASGTLSEPFLLDGRLEANVSDYQLWSSSFHDATDEDRMLSLADVRVETGFRIDADAVALRGGSLQTARSHFFLDGRIGFDSSLDLAFDAVELEMAELSPVAGFPMAGQGWGKGWVRGPFSDLIVRADMNLFGARFMEYALGDLQSTFFVPLSSASYFDRYRSWRDSGGPTPAPLYDLEGLEILEEVYTRADQTHFDGRLRDLSPALMLLPSLSTVIGQSTLNGQLAVFFESPYPLYADLTLPAEVDGRPGGTVQDLLAIPGVTLEDDPTGADAVTGTIRGRATVMGPVEALTGTGTFELTGLQVYGQAIPQASATFLMQAGDLVLEELLAKLPGSEVRMSGMLARDEVIRARIELEGFPLADLSSLEGSELAGQVSGILTAEGSLDAPRLQGQLSAVGLAWSGAPMEDARLTLHTDEGHLVAQGLLFGGQGRLEARVGLSGAMPYDLQVEVAEQHYEDFLFARVGGRQDVQLKLAGRARVRGQLGETPETSEPRVARRSDRDAMPELDATLEQLVFGYRDASVQNASPIALTVRQGRVWLPKVRLAGNGTDLKLSGGVSPEGEVELDLSGHFNLSLIQAMSPETFQRLEGRVRFGDDSSEERSFRIRGTTDALAFSGVALLSDGVVRTYVFPPTLDRLTGRIRVLGEEVRLEQLTGNLGGGALTGRGTIQLGPSYTPSHYDLQLEATDSFLRYPSFLPPGVMDASLRFTGPSDSLLLSGDVTLKRMVYRERYNWEKALTDFRTYRLEELSVESGEPAFCALDIRIHVPETFFVRNNVANAQLKAEFQLVGDTNVMELYGDVESVRGYVTILDNNFELTDCRLEFQGDYYDPLLNLRMETQIQGYTISYTVTGSLEDWQLLPGSDSGLSERDINSLMAFGTLADNLTEGSEARAVASPALEFLIGRLGILEQLQSFTRLDRFTIIPATDQSGNLSARVYGEKEILQDKVFASGYYDLTYDGNQDFLTDLEWRALDCCSLIFRLDSTQQVGALSVSPGIRLKLKTEFE